MSQVLGCSSSGRRRQLPAGPCEGQSGGRSAEGVGRGRGEPPPGCAGSCQCHAREREEVPGPRGARAESRRSETAHPARPPAAPREALWRRRRRAREPMCRCRPRAGKREQAGVAQRLDRRPRDPWLSQAAARQQCGAAAAAGPGPAPSRAPACPAAPEGEPREPTPPPPSPALFAVQSPCCRFRPSQEASAEQRVSRAITLSPTLCPGRGVPGASLPASVFSPGELTASSSEACTPPRA